MLATLPSLGKAVGSFEEAAAATVSMTNVKVNVKEKIPGRGQCALTPDQQEPVQTLLPCSGWGLAGEGILQMGLWIGS